MREKSNMRPSKYIELTQNRKVVHRAEDKQRRSGSENGREGGEEGLPFKDLKLTMRHVS